MKHLVVACALAIALAAAASAVAGVGKPASREGATPDAPAGCISIPSGGAGYGEVRRTPVPAHPTFVVYAYAGWCWNNTNHTITSIQNTVADQFILGHQPCPPPWAPYVNRYSGGIGSTWYTTQIRAWFNCGDGHLHGIDFLWSHNGWGNSEIHDVYSW